MNTVTYLKSVGQAHFLALFFHQVVVKGHVPMCILKSE